MEDYYEHIDDYINGLLPDEQKVQFEAEMGRNASLQKAVDNYPMAKRISEALLEVDMLETLDQLKKTPVDQRVTSSIVSDGQEAKERVVNLDSVQKPKGIFRRQWMAAAVLFGLLAVTAWWIMKPAGDGLDKEYILANFIKPENEDATKSVDTIGKTTFEKGMHLYGLRDYKESIKEFETYLSETSDKKRRSEGYFWLGAAYLWVWKVEKAREAWENSDEEGAKENLRLIEKN